MKLETEKSALTADYTTLINLLNQKFGTWPSGSWVYQKALTWPALSGASPRQAPSTISPGAGCRSLPELCHTHGFALSCHHRPADLTPWLVLGPTSSQDEDVNGYHWMGSHGTANLVCRVFAPPPPSPLLSPCQRLLVHAGPWQYLECSGENNDLMGYLASSPVSYTTTRICARLVVNCGLKH